MAADETLHFEGFKADAELVLRRMIGLMLAQGRSADLGRVFDQLADEVQPGWRFDRQRLAAAVEQLWRESGLFTGKTLDERMQWLAARAVAPKEAMDVNGEPKAEARADGMVNVRVTRLNSEGKYSAIDGFVAHLVLEIDGVEFVLTPHVNDAGFHVSTSSNTGADRELRLTLANAQGFHVESVQLEETNEGS